MSVEEHIRKKLECIRNLYEAPNLPNHIRDKLRLYDILVSEMLAVLAEQRQHLHDLKELLKLENRPKLRVNVTKATLTDFLKFYDALGWWVLKIETKVAELGVVEEATHPP